MNQTKPNQRQAIRSVEFFHAVVFKSSADVAEDILAFLEQCNAQVIFQRHSGRYLRITEENGGADR